MKKLQGIFDNITENLHPGISNKEKVVADWVLYNSGSVRAVEFTQKSNLESMEVPFEGLSMPVEEAVKELKKGLQEKAAKVSDMFFKLPGFSKEDMAVDKGDFLEKGLSGMDMEGLSKKVADKTVDITGNLKKQAEDAIGGLTDQGLMEKGRASKKSRLIEGLSL